MLTEPERQAIIACKQAIVNLRRAKLDDTGRYQWADLDREIHDIQERILRIEAGSERQNAPRAAKPYRPFSRTRAR